MKIQNNSLQNPQSTNPSVISQKSQNQKTVTYQEEGFRYVIIIIFSLAQTTTSILFPTLTPIAVQVEELYDLSSTVVTSGALLYLLMHPVFTIPANITIDKYGIRKSIILGSVLQIIGSAMRILVNKSFLFVIFGYTIAGIGRPFIVNAQGKIVGEWFFPQNRTAISSLFSFMLTVSKVGGILIPGFIFGQYQVIPDDPTNSEHGKKLLQQTMELQAIIAFAFLLPNIILMRDQPKLPPSQSAGMRREDAFQSIAQLFKNINYILLWFTYSIVFGSFNAIAVVISYIVSPFGFNAKETSVIGAAPIATGMIGSLIISLVVKKKPKFKLFIIICVIGTLSSIATFAYFLHYESYLLAITGSLMIGLFMVPSVPLMLELGIEISFPVGEGMSVGMLFAGGQLFGAFISLFLQGFIDGETPAQTYEGTILMVIILFIAALLMVFLKQDLARQKAENIRDAQKSLQRSMKDNTKLQEDLISIQNIQFQQSLAITKNKNPSLPVGKASMNQLDDSQQNSFFNQDKNSQVQQPLIDQSDLEYLQDAGDLDQQDLFQESEEEEFQVTKRISIISQNAF